MGNACVPGQVLTRENIEGIIRFAKEENLFILADEVNLRICLLCISHFFQCIIHVHDFQYAASKT